MILINLIDQHSVLIQYALHLNKTLFKCRLHTLPFSHPYIIHVSKIKKKKRVNCSDGPCGFKFFHV
ncbi:hypothetical protein Hanom_Chr03g00178971 [Helianthus anomalus]